jgi:hypothetical protein
VDRDRNGWWGDWSSGLTWFRPDGARRNGPWANLAQTRQWDFGFSSVIPRRVLVGWDAAGDANDIWSGLFLGWVRFPCALCAGVRHGRANCSSRRLTCLKTRRASRPAW